MKKLYFTDLRIAFDKFNKIRIERDLEPINVSYYHKYVLKYAYQSWEKFIKLVNSEKYDVLINNEQRQLKNKEIKKYLRKLKKEARLADIKQKENALSDQINLIEIKRITELKTKTNNRTRLTEGFVYIITNPVYDGWVKVGSALNMEERLASYQTCDPNRGYKIEFIWHFDNRKEAERLAHNALHKHRGNGEWFKLNVKKAIKIIESLK